MSKTEGGLAAVAGIREQALKYLQIVNPHLSDEETNQFLGIAEAYGLNPFKREIHAGKMYQDGKSRLVPITGYEVYLKRAERTNKLDGWHVEITGDQKDPIARLTIYRKDWSHPFVHEVYYREVVQNKKDGTPNHFWFKSPRFMTKKVVISQGFRLCFSDELGGMPYTADELPLEEEHTLPEARSEPPRDPVVDPGGTTPKDTQKEALREETIALASKLWEQYADVLTDEDKQNLWNDLKVHSSRKEVLSVIAEWSRIAEDRRDLAVADKAFDKGIDADVSAAEGFDLDLERTDSHETGDDE